MAELLTWIKDYSPAVAILLAIGTAAVFILRNAVEKSISAGFESYSRRITRRSNFAEKVLLDRFALITSFASRLEKIMTNLNRLRSGKPVEGFMGQGEIIPLTEVYEDLRQNRIVLTEDFYEIFLNKVKLALRAANATDDIEWKNCSEEWIKLQEDLRLNVERVFKISEIKW